MYEHEHVMYCVMALDQAVLVPLVSRGCCCPASCRSANLPHQPCTRRRVRCRPRGVWTLEPVWQGLASIQTIAAAMGWPSFDASAAGVGAGVAAGATLGAGSSAGASTASMTAQPVASRRLRVGQWVDCLDTVDSWLPATITEVGAHDVHRVALVWRPCHRVIVPFAHAR